MLTFNPHPYETDTVLPSFLTRLWSSNFFLNMKEYAYNIEKTGSQRHLHLFFTSDHRDKNKVLEVFKGLPKKENGEWIPFWNGLKIKETDGKHAFNCVLVGNKNNREQVNRNDRLYYLGYTNKDLTEQVPPYYPIKTNIDTMECMKSYEYWLEYTMVHMKKDDKKDIKVLSSKNVYSVIRDFVEENECDVDHLLWDRMSQVWIMSDFISQSQKDSIIRSCRLAMGLSEFKEWSQYPDPPSYKTFYGNPITKGKTEQLNYTILTNGDKVCKKHLIKEGKCFICDN